MSAIDQIGSYLGHELINGHGPTGATMSTLRLKADIIHLRCHVAEGPTAEVDVSRIKMACRPLSGRRHNHADGHMFSGYHLSGVLAHLAKISQQRNVFDLSRVCPTRIGSLLHREKLCHDGLCFDFDVIVSDEG